MLASIQCSALSIFRFIVIISHEFYFKFLIRQVDMDKPHDFQSMIKALESFWAEQGCLVWQPYYSQVGAGTMNPATFLRVLGPEPWNVAYVEPSVRPDDGRYGENPNRLQMFYQYQVILKPDPGNPQELYLKSLEAIGINPKEHDIRFVEDNWNSPAIGAWGLGWEVWMDGLEITQFTYFQQSGGLNLDPVAVEITYGLDRIAAPLQKAKGFANIQWNQDRTFGDVNMQGEQEHSKYYFEVADIDRQLEIYRLFEQELKDALAARLVLPAYDYLIKLSHTFNILDTRGAVGVTERQYYFKGMRQYAMDISKLFLELREEQSFPWLQGERAISTLKDSINAHEARLKSGEKPDSPAPFIFEIGTEELPAADLSSALEQLEIAMPSYLDELRLSYKNISVMGTPRRIVVLVEELAPSQPNREEWVKGPPASRAFDETGAPTKAAIGFARGKGVDVSALEKREMDGGEYVAALIKEDGKSAIEVLSEAIPQWIKALNFPKNMRWNESNVGFSRPIRWLMAMFGEALVPFDYAGYQAEKVTRGLRFSEPSEFVLKDADEYFEALKNETIILDPNERKAVIAKQVAEIAKQVKGEVIDDPALLDEVSNLVEAPTAILGSFDEEHLALPKEALISVMRKHQRYFPVEKDGKLLPYFVTVANGKIDNFELVREGNESVVRARFADAAFFVNEDLRKPLSAYVPALESLTFQKDLGSMLDKTKRIEAQLDSLAVQLNLDDEERKTAARAATLCKADLATKMVVEMTSLQGVMGRDYALASGEDEDVAIAIQDHYSSAPRSKASLAIGIADKLDSLAGLFAAGLAPTGNKDPFAQRRAALGIVESLTFWDVDFDLSIALKVAAEQLPLPISEENFNACLDFIMARLRVILLDEGYRHDVVDAVLAAQNNNPAGVKRTVVALSNAMAEEDWDVLLPAYARCVRITRSQETVYTADKSVLVEKVEKDLFDLTQKAIAVEIDSIEAFVKSFTPLIDPINAFFDQVLVMAEDEKLKESRLGLLQEIAGMMDGIADLSKIEGF